MLFLRETILKKGFLSDSFPKTFKQPGRKYEKFRAQTNLYNELVIKLLCVNEISKLVLNTRNFRIVVQRKTLAAVIRHEIQLYQGAGILHP